MTIRLRGVDKVTLLTRAPGGQIKRNVIEVDRDDDEDGIEYVVRGPTGQVRHGVMQEQLGHIKKQSKSAKPIDKRLRRSVRRQMKMLDRYLTLHDRSSRKKKNGWMRDLGRNIMKAVRV